MNALQSIKQNKLVAVIRKVKESDVISIGEALLKGGIRVFEITADSSGFLHSIERVKSEFGRDITVGAGTILDSITAKSAINVGAEFIFAPTTNLETIKLTKRYGVVSIPGAMTPTEILTAYEHGADIIKVFPANVLGPKYISDIRGPLQHIPLMPTGGVNLDNIQEYFYNGAVAAGLGNSLVDTNVTIDKNELNCIEDRAKRFVNKISELHL